MRLARMRFTVRRLMIAVAVVSVVLGVTREVGRLRRLSREYRRRAVKSAREERLWRRGLIGRVAFEAEARRLSAVLRPKDRDLAELWAEEASARSLGVREGRAILTHHARLRQKYERAASRPWEPVAPDQPEPRETLVCRCVALPKGPLPPEKRWWYADPSLEEFFSESAEAPFFVKNLENVQGDERDVIFLSVSYGPDETGRVAMRFGPLNQKGGERRLNVAVTRARLGMTVVSSMHAMDIDLTRAGAAGARLLRDYLDFAERGVVALGSEITGANDRDFDSPFEREVSRALEGRGLVVHRQVGCGGFRIDLALADPSEPGRYVLGVECDGATYHGSATARDRDRLHQEVLESLGWTICRVWSTDWVRDPAGQIERVMAAFAKAKASPPAPVRTSRPERTEVPRREGDTTGKGQPNQATARLFSPGYKTIDDVPREVIRGLVLGSLGKFGATVDGELTQSVARQLGFQRMGNRIKTRLDECVTGLIREGKLARTEQGILRIVLVPGHKRG